MDFTTYGKTKARTANDALAWFASGGASSDDCYRIGGNDATEGVRYKQTISGNIDYYSRFTIFKVSPDSTTGQNLTILARPTSTPGGGEETGFSTATIQQQLFPITGALDFSDMPQTQSSTGNPSLVTIQIQNTFHQAGSTDIKGYNFGTSTNQQYADSQLTEANLAQTNLSRRYFNGSLLNSTTLLTIGDGKFRNFETAAVISGGDSIIKPVPQTTGLELDTWTKFAQMDPTEAQECNLQNKFLKVNMIFQLSVSGESQLGTLQIGARAVYGYITRTADGDAITYVTTPDNRRQIAWGSLQSTCHAEFVIPPLESTGTTAVQPVLLGVQYWLNQANVTIDIGQSSYQGTVQVLGLGPVRDNAAIYYAVENATTQARILGTAYMAVSPTSDYALHSKTTVYSVDAPIIMAAMARTFGNPRMVGMSTERFTELAKSILCDSAQLEARAYDPHANTEFRSDFFKDFGNGFMQGLGETTKVLGPLAQMAPLLARAYEPYSSGNYYLGKPTYGSGFLGNVVDSIFAPYDKRKEHGRPGETPLYNRLTATGHLSGVPTPFYSSAPYGSQEGGVLDSQSTRSTQDSEWEQATNKEGLVLQLNPWSTGEPKRHREEGGQPSAPVWPDPFQAKEGNQAENVHYKASGRDKYCAEGDPNSSADVVAGCHGRVVPAQLSSAALKQHFPNKFKPVLQAANYSSTSYKASSFDDDVSALLSGASGQEDESDGEIEQQQKSKKKKNAYGQAKTTKQTGQTRNRKPQTTEPEDVTMDDPPPNLSGSGDPMEAGEAPSINDPQQPQGSTIHDPSDPNQDSNIVVELKVKSVGSLERLSGPQALDLGKRMIRQREPMLPDRVADYGLIPCPPDPASWVSTVAAKKKTQCAILPTCALVPMVEYNESSRSGSVLLCTVLITEQMTGGQFPNLYHTLESKFKTKSKTGESVTGKCYTHVDKRILMTETEQERLIAAMEALNFQRSTYVTPTNLGQKSVGGDSWMLGFILANLGLVPGVLVSGTVAVTTAQGQQLVTASPVGHLQEKLDAWASSNYFKGAIIPESQMDALPQTLFETYRAFQGVSQTQADLASNVRGIGGVTKARVAELNAAIAPQIKQYFHELPEATRALVLNNFNAMRMIIQFVTYTESLRNLRTAAKKAKDKGDRGSTTAALELKSLQQSFQTMSAKLKSLIEKLEADKIMAQVNPIEQANLLISDIKKRLNALALKIRQGELQLDYSKEDSYPILTRGEMINNLYKIAFQNTQPLPGYTFARTPKEHRMGQVEFVTYFPITKAGSAPEKRSKAKKKTGEVTEADMQLDNLLGGDLFGL